MRLDIKTINSRDDLIQEISQYIPINNFSIKPVKKSFSKNIIYNLIKKGEKFHKAISIPVNDLLHFIQKLEMQTFLY